MVQANFFWVLSLSVINGWLLYKRHADQRHSPIRDQMDLLLFIARVSDCLIKKDKSLLLLATPRRRGRPPAEAATLAGIDSDISDSESVTTPKRKSAPQNEVPLEIRMDHVTHSRTSATQTSMTGLRFPRQNYVF